MWYVWFTIERSDVDSFRIRKDGKFVETFIEIFDNILSKFYCSILRPSVGFFVSVGWWSDLPITSFDLFGYEIEEEEVILRKPKLPLVYSINREMLTSNLRSNSSVLRELTNHKTIRRRVDRYRSGVVALRSVTLPLAAARLARALSHWYIILIALSLFGVIFRLVIC